MPTHSCAALVVAAPASGQGKTSVTAALACYFQQQGRQVRVFKVGPDFLDPMILERASGHPVYQLDLWMIGEQHSRQLLAEAAAQADLILIEGVMGLFDGAPCTADLAATLGTPILAVIDASAMAQTFAAVAFGLARYRSDINVAAVIANRVGSERHWHMLLDALAENLPCYAALPRQQTDSLPSRYLGLKQAAEIDDLDHRLQQLAEQLMINHDVPLPDIEFSSNTQPRATASLSGVRIAVARDAAFSFIYQANLDLLTAMGAELCFFSPLQDAELPPADSLYLPGGYPELYLQQLSDNQTMRQAIENHFLASKPVLAECGGLLYLCESLTDKHGHQAAMAGLLPAKAEMQPRLTALALQEITIDGETVRGHSYHHSSLQTELTPVACALCPNGSNTSEAVYQQRRLTGSYIHFYFPSNPAFVAELFSP